MNESQLVRLCPHIPQKNVILAVHQDISRWSPGYRRIKRFTLSPGNVQDRGGVDFICLSQVGFTRFVGHEGP